MIKLDLEKAYDKINWDFICSVLHNFHFPTKWVNLIRACITTVQHCLIINGSTTNRFSPKRGIRQGEPISPYLFILCMETLTFLINKKVGSRNWTPVGFRDVTISHLLYANDVLLFAKVNNKSIKAINAVLESFMPLSGLNINLSKSSVWFSPNTPTHIRASSSLSLGIKEPLD